MTGVMVGNGKAVHVAESACTTGKAVTATDSAITCKRCSKAATAAPLFELESVTDTADTPDSTDVVTTDRIKAAREARKQALITANWAAARQHRAERMAAERAKLAARNAESRERIEARIAADKAAALKAAAAARKAAAARAANLAARAERLAAVKAEREAAAATEREARRAAARELAASTKAIAELTRGIDWRQRVSGDMTTDQKTRMSESGELAAIAESLGKDARVMAEQLAAELDDYRADAAARRAAEYVPMVARDKDVVHAYRASSGYKVGRKVLRELGKDVAAVVVAREADIRATVYSVTRVKPSETLAYAQGKREAAAAKLAAAILQGDKRKTTAARQRLIHAETAVTAAAARESSWERMGHGVAWTFVAELGGNVGSKRMDETREAIAAAWNDARAERMKAAKNRMLADPTATNALDRVLSKPKTNAERQAAYKARQRELAGKGPARAYSMTARKAAAK